jgi:hypothetical protein
LLDCDLPTGEGQGQAQKEKHFKKALPQKFVQDASEIRGGMLKD